MLHERFINLYGDQEKKEKNLELFFFFLHFELKNTWIQIRIQLKSWIRIRISWIRIRIQ